MVIICIESYRKEGLVIDGGHRKLIACRTVSRGPTSTFATRDLVAKVDVGPWLTVWHYESKFILDSFIFWVSPAKFLRGLAANVDFSTWSRDFLDTVDVAQDDGESHPVHVLHKYELWSGFLSCSYRPSSVTSESTKSNGFRIYPTEESDDRLVTKALFS